MGYRHFVFLHRWSGIIAAALVIVCGLTGSALVFRNDLDRWLNADILEVTPRGAPLSADELVSRVERRFPEAWVGTLLPQDDPARAWTLTLARRGAAGISPGGERFSPNIIHIDPYSGSITGTRTRGEGGLDRRRLVPLVHGLHHDLLLGGPGHWAVAGVGAVWLLLSLVGIYLSVKQAGGFSRAFRIRADVGLKRLFLDMHRTFGMASVIVVVAICVSGIYLGLRQDVTKLVSAFSAVTPLPERALPADQVDEPAIGFGEAIRAAEATLPGSRVQSVFAVRPKGVYRARMIGQGDINERGDRFLYVSMRDARIVAARDVKEGSAGDVFVGWQFPLHTGEAFGATGRTVIFIVGLLPALFSVTGVYLWLAGRRPRRLGLSTKQRSQQPSGSQQSAISKTS